MATASSAACVLPCGKTFDSTLAFFTKLLNGTLFAIDEIFPADSPKEATLSGQGLTLHLTCEGDKEKAPGSGVRLQLVATADSQTLTSELAPNGTIVQWVACDRSNRWKSIASPVRTHPVPLALPPLVAPSTVIVSHASDDSFGTGRAGMLYRDLVPCRLGGALIASAIKIPSGGPVPDYVHFHLVRFQMIYCVAGWVRLVYEGQGEPFLLHAGDLVLQPPTIRHRVLESSDGLEVLELGVPAEHTTRADRNCPLPDSAGHDDTPLNKKPKMCPLGKEVYGGQRFCRFVAGSEQPVSQPNAAFSGLDWFSTGIGIATDGLAEVLIGKKAESKRETRFCEQTNDIFFTRVNQGTAVLQIRTTTDTEQVTSHTLQSGETFIIPRGMCYRLSNISDGTEVLQATLQTYCSTVSSTDD